MKLLRNVFYRTCFADGAARKPILHHASRHYSAHAILYILAADTYDCEQTWINSLLRQIWLRIHPTETAYPRMLVRPWWLVMLRVRSWRALPLMFRLTGAERRMVTCPKSLTSLRAEHEWRGFCLFSKRWNKGFNLGTTRSFDVASFSVIYESKRLRRRVCCEMARAGNVIFRGQISPDRYRPLYNGITLKYFFCVRRTTWAAWKVNERRNFVETGNFKSNRCLFTSTKSRSL